MTADLPRPAPRTPLLRDVLPPALAVLAAFGLLAWALLPPGALAAPPWKVAVLAVLAVVLAAGVVWGIAQHRRQTIDALADAVERLGRGERVHGAVARDGPLGRLQRGVNAASQARDRMQGELERARAELADSNARLEAARQSRSRFLAAASHDLRQPLYALTLFSSALRAGETDPDKRVRLVHIEDCVASLDQLFAELLDLSRLEAGAMQATLGEVRLDEVFDEVSRNFRMPAESRGLRLVVRRTDAWVRGDRTMLARILNNLVSNALRYTDAGGVLVGVRGQPAGRVRIDVWDTGAGIAPEHQQRVFDEFYRVRRQSAAAGERPRGLGLGLSTVRKLAELLGCQVRLASRPGRGTCVSLLLEAATPAIGAAPSPADLPIDISGLRVMVIDDDEAILQGLRALLQEWGCTLLLAGDAATAVRKAARWPTPPDLVISDLHLGDDASGLDVLQALAGQYRQGPAHPGFARLVVTGETRQERLAGIASQRIPVLFWPVSRNACARRCWPRCWRRTSGRRPCPAEASGAQRTLQTCVATCSTASNWTFSLSSPRSSKASTRKRSARSAGRCGSSVTRTRVSRDSCRAMDCSSERRMRSRFCGLSRL